MFVPDGLWQLFGSTSTLAARFQSVLEFVEPSFAVDNFILEGLFVGDENLGELLGRFRRVLLPELNLGQLALLLRARYLVDIESFTKVAGQPFKVFELQEKIEQMLEETK